MSLPQRIRPIKIESLPARWPRMRRQASAIGSGVLAVEGVVPSEYSLRRFSSANATDKIRANEMASPELNHKAALINRVSRSVGRSITAGF